MSRGFGCLITAMLLITLAACGSDDDAEPASGGDSPATTEGEEESSPITAQRVEVDSDAVAGVTVTAPPLGDRGPEPSGTLDFAWHTAFSPVWFDPSQNISAVTPYATQYILHDALVKGIPGQVFAPSLAEEYTVADDFTWASFRLREGLTFHDGSPLTTEDVKFSYENYSGTNSDQLKARTEEIEIVDDLNITFHFNSPFLDFMTLYGSTATGAGWVLPSDYYQEVGPEGFLAAPIGAGPFKFVENQDNNRITYEANTDYWKKNPGVQTLNWHNITDNATRFAALQTGEVDMANVFPGDLIDAIVADPNLTLVPTTATSVWLEFVGYEDPASPFHDRRVREAVSLALDRALINEAETGGAGSIQGQWVPADRTGALSVDEPYEYNPERARELMAEAGYPDGFDAGILTPLPNYFPLGERVITMLGDIGITAELNQMDRGAFLAGIGAGKDGELEGLIVNISGAGGDAMSRVRNFATCDGVSSRICDQRIDDAVAAYDAAVDPDERQAISDEIQQYMIDELHFVYIYDLGLNMAQGPDVEQPADEIWAQIPQVVYPGPWEDITVRN